MPLAAVKSVRMISKFLLEVEVTAQGSDAEAHNACLCETVALVLATQ